MAEYLTFGKGSPESLELVKWWQALESDRRARAELRRCRNPAEVVFSPAYHRLRRAILRIEGAKGIQDGKLALVVGLAARVKTNNESMDIAEQMATGKGDKAVVSGLRFRRMLKARGGDEVFTLMSRIISLLGGAVNLQSLAQSVYWWNDKTQKEWAFSYYSKAPHNEA